VDQPVGLIGQRFTHLLVVGQTMIAARRRGEVLRWVCRCDCGAPYLAQTCQLTGPHPRRSCGCDLSRDRSSVRKYVEPDDLDIVPFGNATVTLACGHVLTFYDTAPPWVGEPVWCTGGCRDYAKVTNVDLKRQPENTLKLRSDQLRQEAADAKERMDALRASLSQPA
jgi:hypothetical protein